MYIGDKLLLLLELVVVVLIMCLCFVLQTWMNVRKTMVVVTTSATTRPAVIAVTAMLAIS